MITLMKDGFAVDMPCFVETEKEVIGTIAAFREVNSSAVEIRNTGTVFINGKYYGVLVFN